MSSESMLDRLDRYYHEQNISASDFKCKHLNACRSVCKPGEMVSLPEAYVGPEYVGPKDEAETPLPRLPRLLFVSSDPNDSSWVKGDYATTWFSLKNIRDDKLQNHRWAPAKTHWGQTLKLAGALLAPFALKCLSKGIDQDKIVEYIAHANSTRCKDCTIGSKEGNPIMRSNCRDNLVGEVIIMQPAIIVTQGKRAREALAEAFRVIRRVAMPGHPDTIYQLVQLDENHTAIMIVAKHPCARGKHGWKRGEKKSFVEWATKSVQELISPA
jgi:hypothetical protein